MNNFRKVFYLLFFLTLKGISINGVKLKVIPNGELVIKYVGDALSLTCYIQHEGTSADDTETQSIFPLAHSHFPVHTLTWVIPTNAEDRVNVDEFDDKVVVQIINLKETDSGNYTCDLRTQLNASVYAPPKKKIVTLLVRPKGLLSDCGQNSFYCEKNLCIHSRYECDGVADCTKGNDEDHYHCAGRDQCSGKLKCEDGRCLSPKFCCLDTSQSPPNCSISANIRCCRQLIHPALLDQDLHYLASRPRLKQNFEHQSLVMISVIGISICFLAFIVIALYYFKGCHMKLRTTSDSRSSLWNAFTQRNNANPTHTSPSNQYLLHTALSSLPSHHSNERAPCNIFLPMDNGYMNSRSNFAPGPPPSYQHAIGGPPPPYSSHESMLPSQLPQGPLLMPPSFDDIMLNNNNGDINGNSALPYEDRNMLSQQSFPQGVSSSSSDSSSSDSLAASSSSSTSSERQRSPDREVSLYTRK